MKEKIPFIHLLESPNGKYFFDVNANEIVPVSEASYYALQKIIKNQPIDLNNNEKQEIKELESIGYLSNNKVKVIKHWATDFLEDFMNRKIGKITLQLTQSCNLRCAYCVYSDKKNEKQRKHSGKRMSFEIAKKGVDFLLEHSIDSEEINVAFYGGEPLLEFDLVKKIVSYVEQEAQGRKYSFSITTNGTLVTEEMIDYFVEHEIPLSISLDGPKEVHDVNRRMADGEGSFEKVIETLKRIYEKYPDYIKTMLISMVLQPNSNFDDINSVFEEYAFLKDIILIPASIDDTYSEEKIYYSEEYIKGQEYRVFLGFLNYLDRLNADYLPLITKKQFERLKTDEEKFNSTTSLPYQTAPSGPCIPGQMRLFIDTDGNFFPCERVNEVSDVMMIGNIESGFFLDKVDALLNIGNLTDEKCRNCWAFVRCNLCGKHADDGNKLSGELKSTYCDSVRGNSEYFLYNIILLEEYQKFYS